jgi:hypothetical protein
MSEEINQKPKFNNILSSQSFEVLGETPKTNDKDCSYDILDDDNEPQTLDEDIIDNNDKIKVQHDFLEKNYLQKENYSFQKERTKNAIYLLKESKQNTNTRREIRSLERHLEKLEESEKNNVDYVKFKENMNENAKNDKNMNKSLRNLYL